MVKGGAIDKNTGRDVGLVEAGLVEVGMGVLAVTAHLQTIAIRDRGSIRLHFRQDSSS